MRLFKTQVIINPASDQGRTGGRWSQIKETLKTFLKEYTCEFTEKPRHAIEISRAAVKKGNELILGVGGDGTINEIANGFFENQSLINPEIELGILPSGTGCDFIRSLNIPQSFRGAMEVITQPQTSKIDIGKISFTNYDLKPEDRYFLNITDFGIGGEVAEHMDKTRQEKKAASYLKSLITTFLRYKFKKLNITVDGEEIADKEFMIGAVANGRVFGRGMRVAPRAILDDGLFDFILVKKLTKLDFLRNLMKLYKGTHLDHPKVSFLRGRTIEASPVDDDQRVLLEVDGEQVGILPARFEILPRCLTVKGALS